MPNKKTQRAQKNRAADFGVRRIGEELEDVYAQTYNRKNRLFNGAVTAPGNCFQLHSINTSSKENVTLDTYAKTYGASLYA